MTRGILDLVVSKDRMSHWCRATDSMKPSKMKHRQQEGGLQWKKTVGNHCFKGHFTIIITLQRHDSWQAWETHWDKACKTTGVCFASNSACYQVCLSVQEASGKSLSFTTQHTRWWSAHIPLMTLTYITGNCARPAQSNHEHNVKWMNEPEIKIDSALDTKPTAQKGFHVPSPGYMLQHCKVVSYVRIHVRNNRPVYLLVNCTQ